MRILHTIILGLSLVFGLQAQDFDIRVVPVDQPANEGECGHIGIQVKFDRELEVRASDVFLSLSFTLAYDASKVDISTFGLDEVNMGSAKVENTKLPASAAVQSPLELTAPFTNPNVVFVPMSNISLGNEIGLNLGKEWTTVQVFDYFVNGGCGAIAEDPSRLFDIAHRDLVGDFNDPQFNFNNKVYRGLPQHVAGGPILSELFTFKAERLEERSAVLTWDTENKQEADFFRVERSSDGTNWQFIGRVDAANNAAVRSYRYTDKNVFSERQPDSEYSYHVIMIDSDGKSVYSNIDQVQFKGSVDMDELRLAAFPNPSIDGLNVQFVQGANVNATTMELVNTLGQIVYNGVIAEMSETEYIDYSVIDVKSGAYVLRVTDDDGKILASKAIVVSR